jgi:O-antigen/teichoic acid export membrane protein
VIKLLYFISFVIAAVFTFESTSIVTLVFGNQYSATAYSASILYWCQIFIFFAFYSLSVLIADNKQHYNFIYAGIQAAVNVLFCFILIPGYSFVGASIAKLLASFLSFVFILFALDKSGFRPSIGRYRVLIWSVTLAGILWLASLLPFIAYLLISALAVLIITLATKLFSSEELITFFKLANREAFGKKLLAKLSLLRD